MLEKWIKCVFIQESDKINAKTFPISHISHKCLHAEQYFFQFRSFFALFAEAGEYWKELSERMSGEKAV